MPRLGVLLVAVALVASACGGDSDPPATAPDRATDATSTSAPAHDPAGNGSETVLELSAENIEFSVSSLEADSGEVTIRFANNDDGIPHNLHVTGDGVDEKTKVEPGPANQRLSMTLSSGTYTYVCDVHPQQMSGELTVT